MGHGTRADLRYIRRVTPVRVAAGIASLIAVVSSHACAPTDACLRHSDCDDGLSCIDGQCQSEGSGGEGGDGGDGGDGG